MASSSTNRKNSRRFYDYFVSGSEGAGGDSHNNNNNNIKDHNNMTRDSPSPEQDDAEETELLEKVITNLNVNVCICNHQSPTKKNVVELWSTNFSTSPTTQLIKRLNERIDALRTRADLESDTFWSDYKRIHDEHWTALNEALSAKLALLKRIWAEQAEIEMELARKVAALEDAILLSGKEFDAVIQARKQSAGFTQW